MVDLYKWYYDIGWTLPGTGGLDLIEEKYGREVRETFIEYKNLKFDEKVNNWYKQALEEMP
jgi:hypothetical protein